MQQIAPRDLKAWMDDGGRPAPAILDVREPWEVAICAIPGALSMPMSQIAGRLGDLGTDRDWIVVCHHGMRSLQVARFLEQAGFPRVFNLQGGIDAWARDVAPSIARY